jgi:acyl-CoA thioester hydrolase
MYQSEVQVRVRYAETDQMGYVYYGNYASYFEVARVETLRNLGFSYRTIEADGIILPVLSYSIKYIKPAYYDDLLTIKTVIKDIPLARIKFDYETYNEKDELINIADTTLVFINKLTNKPCAAPADFLAALKKFF